MDPFAMVERYRHDDPMPKDPWLIRMFLKHTKLSYFILLGFTVTMVAVVVGSRLYAIHAQKQTYVTCVHTQSAKILADILKDGFIAESAPEVATREAACVCCRKMNRIPVESGQYMVLCLPVDDSTLVYKSKYMPADN